MFMRRNFVNNIRKIKIDINELKMKVEAKDGNT